MNFSRGWLVGWYTKQQAMQLIVSRCPADKYTNTFAVAVVVSLGSLGRGNMLGGRVLAGQPMAVESWLAGRLSALKSPETHTMKSGSGGKQYCKGTHKLFKTYNA